jgi:hypothetical protein
MTTRQFFASLRHFFALDANRVSSGEVVADYIEREFIPTLTRIIREEENPELREQYEEALKLWEASVSSANRKKWAQAAALAVGATIEGTRGLSVGNAEDIESDIAAYLHTKPGAKKWLENFATKGATSEMPYKGLLQGPKPLVTLFRTVMTNQARYRKRTLINEMKRRAEPDRYDESKSVIEELEAPAQETELDRQYMKRVWQRWQRWMEQKLSSDDVAMAVWEGFLEEAMERGAEKVKMDRHVYPALVESTGLSKSSLARRWPKVKKLMVEFVEEKMGHRMTDKFKKYWKNASSDPAERIAMMLAYEEWHNRFARWLLGGLGGS